MLSNVPPFFRIKINVLKMYMVIQHCSYIIAISLESPFNFLFSNFYLNNNIKFTVIAHVVSKSFVSEEFLLTTVTLNWYKNAIHSLI